MIKEVRLIDIAEVERAKKGKIYKKGSVFFPLSAVSEISKVEELKEDGEVDGRYAVATPFVEVVDGFFHIAVSRMFPDFIRRYSTTINIQIEVLKEFRLIWNFDKKEQENVVKCISLIDKEIEIIEEQIRLEKVAKKIFLSHLFP